MKERPILFSGPMVQAILANRKTQTRRVVKQVPPLDCTYLKWHEGPKAGQPRWIMDWGLSGCYTDDNGQHWLDIQTDVDDNSHEEIFCPYGQPGDRLWVRETWQQMEHIGGDIKESIVYRADAEHKYGWRPSIFMPRWASRLTLEVVKVRVEPLQAITEEDALAEGFTAWTHRTEGQITARRGFMELWDKINGKKHPWDANQYVWAITFRRIEP